MKAASIINVRKPDGTVVGLPVFTGPPGVGVQSIVKISGDGSPGSTDVYGVMLTDGTVGGTFTVYNPKDGEGGGGSGTGNVSSDDVDTIIVCDQADYDALEEHPSTTLYMIRG